MLLPLTTFATLSYETNITSVTHSTAPRVPLFFSSPQLNVICDLLQFRRTATWNLFFYFSAVRSHCTWHTERKKKRSHGYQSLLARSSWFPRSHLESVPKIMNLPEYVSYFLQSSSNRAWKIPRRSLASLGGILETMGPLKYNRT